VLYFYLFNKNGLPLFFVVSLGGVTCLDGAKLASFAVGPRNLDFLLYNHKTPSLG
jgi:hypothetical protein